ncbi:MAG: histidinol dehydrogenase [Gammaproteobacteria bacterium]|nr:histidinol dehydrogenase [Gammaproteobacteria bacterium]
MFSIHEWNAVTDSERDSLLQRPAHDAAVLIEQQAADIIEQVRRDGDAGVRAVTARIDGTELTRLQVAATDLAAALTDCDGGLRSALTVARDNVAAFHAAQPGNAVQVETVPGVVCERREVPIETVGLYVPAGSAPLVSSVIMQAVPAQLAGCPRRILCTPPQTNGDADPTILAAAALCGIDEVFAIGGAQAIAAMAYGTETVPRVDKIFGPGNAWVAAAKKLVTQGGATATDLVAGPSEVLVVADGGADPVFVAADLLAQAEHGADSQVLLVSTDTALVDAVVREAQRQLQQLARSGIVRECLENSVAIVVDKLDDAFDIVNRYAPEHLILQITDARRWLDRVRNAGSVFLGRWTPEALGDYCSGTNHVLPTGGNARNSSGLGVADFQKTITVQEATAAGLERLGPTATTLARVERLDGHAQSVDLRLARLRAGAA